MPTSLPLYDEDIFDLVRKVNPITILDVGPGYGRMGVALRERSPHSTIDAVEIDQEYRDKFNLSSIYNTVHIDHIKDFCASNPSLRYDIALFNDILEHLFRSEAMDVLDFMLYRCKFIVVQWPNNFLQDAWEGHESEVHRSNFHLRDFLNHQFDVLKYRRMDLLGHGFSMNYCVLRGYKNITDIQV